MISIYTHSRDTRCAASLSSQCSKKSININVSWYTRAMGRDISYMYTYIFTHLLSSDALTRLFFNFALSIYPVRGLYVDIKRILHRGNCWNSKLRAVIATYWIKFHLIYRDMMESIPARTRHASDILYIFARIIYTSTSLLPASLQCCLLCLQLYFTMTAPGEYYTAQSAVRLRDIRLRVTRFD